MKLRGMSAGARRKSRKSRRTFHLEMMERRELLTIYTVINNGDTGTGTLRQAIINANGNPGGDTIRFNLPNTELVINPLTPLPTLTDSGTTIDGTSQTGYDKTTGQPLVVIDGSKLPAAQQGPGLAVSGGSCTIKGLTIDNFAGFSSAGIALSGSPGDLVQDCYIGTSANGLTAAANGGNGISIGASSSTIGGVGVGQRNVISGNGGQGINITNANKTVVQGNYIGLGADGSTVVANAFDGIDMTSSVGNQIGGIAVGAGNVISGNGFQGIFIFVGGSTGDTIQGNFIGTDSTGTVAQPNGNDGILIQDGGSVTIGGVGNAGNVISGNGGSGILLLGSNAKNISIAGNLIGVAASGGGSVPNKGAGILVNGAANDVIGGGAVTLGNVIANNGASGNQAGIFVLSGQGIEILSNSIHDNANGGIFLSPGANADIPAPVITSAQSAAGITEIRGTLTVDPASGANDNFTIQFFDNQAADAAGKFEGKTLIGQTVVTADLSGNATFDVRLPIGTTIGDNITATTTQQQVQNTSQFSAPVPVVAAPTTDLVVTVAPSSSPDLLGVNETYTVTVANTGANDDTNVVYTGAIDNNSSFVSAVSSQGAAATFSNGVITANLGTIAAGKSATITIVVTPIAAGSISLTSTALGDVIDVNPSNNTAVVTPVTVSPSADLSVTIDANPNPVAAGQQFAFVVTVVNNGPSVATNVSVTDILPAGLTGINVDPGQSVLTESGNTLTFTYDSLPIGGSDTLTITANAPTASGPIIDSASISSLDVADPVMGNNSTSKTEQVENAVNLAVAVAAAPNPVLAGSPLTYTIAVSNNNTGSGQIPSTATAAVLTDTLPAGVTLNGVTLNGVALTNGVGPGTFTLSNGTLTINLPAIPANSSPPVVAITVTPTISGTYTNKATISDAVEINTNTAGTSVTTTVLASPSDLAVTIAASPSPASIGVPLNYVITVTNNGPSPAPGSVLVVRLPAGVAIKPISPPSQGSFSLSGSVVTATLGTVAVGKPVTMVITVVPTLSGPMNAVAGTASLDVDPNLGNNVTSNTTLVSPSDLAVTALSSTQTPTVGDAFVEAFNVFNFGPAAAVNAGVNIVLPANTAYAGSSATQGFTGLAGGVLSAALGTIPVNTFATVFVTLIPTATGAVKDTATAFSATNYDPNPTNNLTVLTETAANFPGTFQLSAANYAGGENAGTIPITIQRLNGTLGAIDVSYTTGGGTAVAGVNYTATSGVIQFAAGDTSKTVFIPVKDDGVITGNLTVGFAITGLDNGGLLGKPSAALVTIVNTDRDLTPPEVLSVVPILSGGSVAGYVVDFSKALNPATAGNAGNYTLFASGRDAGTANTFISVAAALYNAGNNSVTLIPPTSLSANKFYGLMINGSNSAGVTDLSGNVLDGAGTGVAGSSYAALIGIGSNLNYVDSGGNLVNLNTSGATMLVSRSFSGDPYDVELLGVGAGGATLNGSVHRVGASSGATAISEIDGLGAFGSVRSNLTTPPFFVTRSIFSASLPVPQDANTAELIGALVPNGPAYVRNRLLGF